MPCCPMGPALSNRHCRCGRTLGARLRYRLITTVTLTISELGGIMASVRVGSNIAAILTSVVVGAVVCGVLAPEVGLFFFVLRFNHPASFREALAPMFVALRAWHYAYSSLGPITIVLGGVSGFLLSLSSFICRSRLVEVAAATVLGLTLGGALPVVLILVGALLLHTSVPNEGYIREICETAPVGVLTGLVCNLLLLLVLRRIGSLYESNDGPSTRI